MSSSNLDAYNLASMNLDGGIHEDVMSQIWNISKVPLPYTELVGSGSHDNQYFSWRLDKLQAQDFDNASVDGSDIDQNDTKLGRRVGNHSQLSDKEIRVSHRANAVNTIGYAKELSYQLTHRQQELRRDVEGIALLNQASVEGTDTVAGRAAGLPAWLTNLDVDGNAVTTGNIVDTSGGWAPGGWDATPGDKLVAAATPGVPEALTETKVRDVMEAVWERGNRPGSFTGMTTGKVKRRFSEYLFTSSARIASQIQDQGSQAQDLAVSGSVDIFLSDFGTLHLTPNALQPSVGADPAVHDNDALYIIDPSLIELSYLQGYRVDPLAKTGHSDKRMLSVDWSQSIKNWEGLGMIPDIDPTAAVTFS